MTATAFPASASGLHPVMTPLRNAVIGALIVAIGPISLSLYSPAMPVLVNIFGTTASMLKLTMTTYFFGYAFSQLFCGPMSDAFGRRSVALAFFTVYLIGSLMALVAPSIGTLLAARTIQGIGVGAGAAVSRAIVRDQFDGLAGTKIMNLIGLMLAVGPAVSPMLGGIILGLFGWHWIFLAMAVYGIVVLLVLWLAAKETNRSLDPARARPGQVLRNYAKLSKSGRFMAPVVVLGCTVGAVYTLSPLMPFLLIERLGLSNTGFGFAMLAQTGSYALGSFCTAWLLKKTSEERVVALGLSLLAVAGLGLALALRLLPLSVPVILVPVGVLAFGMALVLPSSTTRALSGTASLAGAASALMGFVQIGGGLAGSASAALFFSDPVTAFATVVPILVSIAVLVALVSRPLSVAQTSVRDAPSLEDLEVALDPMGVLGAGGDEIEARVHSGGDRPS